VNNKGEDEGVNCDKSHKLQLFEKFPKAIQKDVRVWNIGNSYLRYDGELERDIRGKIKNLS